MHPGSELSVSIISFALTCLDGLGITLHGSYHIEIFERQGEYIFLEAANRPPGGALIELYEKTTGINICNQDLYIWLNKSIDDESDFQPGFTVAAPQQEGVLHGFSIPSLPFSIDINVRVLAGERMQKPLSIANKAITVSAFGNDYSDMFKAYQSLRAFKFVNTQ
ncbi:hypothetical protein [Endozoicomonas sp. Mp262]|uniref:hypothetical protein n=1 Tax=Endozoicomonas sp. Mp262 TaxID=2919499 RepID=UPI0021DAC07B